MQIGLFRRNVGKTLIPRPAKLALRTVAKNTMRTQIAQATVALKRHTGQLLQTTGQYLLGLPQTQEMKQDAFADLGDIGYDLTALARVLKVKLPSSTKKIKLSGTRGAAILQLDSLATDLLRQAEQGLFQIPKMTTTKKMVTLPQTGSKEERDVDVVDAPAELEAEQARQTQMRSFLSGAIDVYWRLCYDMTGQPPVGVLDAKIARLKVQYPAIAFDMVAKKKAAPQAETPTPQAETPPPTPAKKAGKKPAAKPKPQPEPEPATA